MDARDVLKSIYLFRDASSEDLAALAAIAEQKPYMVEETVYRSGETPDALFIVEWGTVDVILKDKDSPLASVGAGQSLGEMAFFERSERVASAIAREPSRLIRLPFAQLDALFATHPKLASSFYHHACMFCVRLLRTLAPDVNRRHL